MGTDHFDGSQAADFNLLLGIGESLVGESKRFFLHARVFVGVNQIPVHRLNLIHSGNDLQAEGHVRKLAVILGDEEEAIVCRETETLQQMLRKLKFEAGVQSRADCGEGIVGGGPRVIETHRNIGSPFETLRVGEISRRRPLQRSSKRTGGNKVGVIFLQGASDDWVKARDR